MREALIKKRTSEVGWAGLSGAPNAQVAILRCLLVLKRLYLDSIEAKGCWRYGTVLVGYGNKDMNDPVFLPLCVLVSSMLLSPRTDSTMPFHVLPDVTRVVVNRHRTQT